MIGRGSRTIFGRRKDLRGRWCYTKGRSPKQLENDGVGNREHVKWERKHRVQ